MMTLLEKLGKYTKDYNNNNNMSLILAAAVSLGCVSMGYHYGVVKRKPSRKAKTGCACGKIEIEIEQPPANYAYMDASCIQCTCEDCLGFCEEVLKQGTSKMSIKDMGQPGIATTVFYNSELKVVKGKEYLQTMKLSEKSENLRIYSTCCGTPIVIANEHAPINLVYCCNIKQQQQQQQQQLPEEQQNGRLNVTASCCFHSRKGDTVPPGSKIRMINGANAPRDILGIVSRLLFLVFAGSYGPGSGIAMEEGKTVGIGKESIKIDNKKE